MSQENVEIVRRMNAAFNGGVAPKSATTPEQSPGPYGVEAGSGEPICAVQCLDGASALIPGRTLAANPVTLRFAAGALVAAAPR